MTPEQREAAKAKMQERREKFKNMTPEQREEAKQKMKENRRQRND